MEEQNENEKVRERKKISEEKCRDQMKEGDK